MWSLIVISFKGFSKSNSAETTTKIAKQYPGTLFLLADWYSIGRELYSDLYRKARVAVITYPWKSMAPYKLLFDLALLLDQIFTKVSLVTMTWPSAIDFGR